MHRLTADRSPADHTTSTTWAGSPATDGELESYAAWRRDGVAAAR